MMRRVRGAGAMRSLRRHDHRFEERDGTISASRPPGFRCPGGACAVGRRRILLLLNNETRERVCGVRERCGACAACMPHAAEWRWLPELDSNQRHAD